MPNSDPLSQLKDIHLPAEVSWWPPAPGWWVLAAFSLIFILWLLWAAYRAYRRRAYKREALREIKRLGVMLEQDTTLRADEFAGAVSQLLKRTALAVFGREQTASLNGRAWLKFLDRSGGGTTFSEGSGRLLAALPYAPRTDVSKAQLQNLLAAATLWIKRQ